MIFTYITLILLFTIVPSSHQFSKTYPMLSSPSITQPQSSMQTSHPSITSPPTSLHAKKIQFLISDTGGGHRASALSLRTSINKLDPTVICDIVDIYTTYCPIFPFSSYPAIYKFMTEWGDGVLWKLFYEGGETDAGIAFNRFLTSLFCTPFFTSCLTRPGYNNSPNLKDGPEDYVVPPPPTSRASMVVSVHPLTQDLPLSILQTLDSKSSKRTPFVTVCTDLGSASRSWFHPRSDVIVVPTKVLEDKAVRVCEMEGGRREGQRVERIGLPIRGEFGDVGEGGKEEWRVKAGIEADKPMVLVVGGGDGMGGIAETAKEVIGECGKVGGQVVVVCGSNKEAKKELEGLYGGDDGVKILGYTTEMAMWMKGADVLVTKGGPGTLAEAACVGVPTVISSYLPGQEEGNVDFVEKGGWGGYIDSNEGIGREVGRLLRDEEERKRMEGNAKKAGRAEASDEIAKLLLDILEEA